jgi:signal transduction histidine kinase
MTPSSHNVAGALDVAGDRWLSKPAWLAEVRWSGFGVVVVASTINATRRTINFVLDPPFSGWLLTWAEMFAHTMLFGVAMLLPVVYVIHRYPRAGRRQYLAVALAILASCALTTVVSIVLETRGTLTQENSYSGKLGFLAMFLIGFLRYSVLGGLVAAAYLFLRTEAESAATAHQCDVEAARLEEQAVQAQLQVLEAQIEPHFLFNALATVKRLFQTSPDTGDRMLENMMRYLAIALPQMRAGDSTVDREVALAEAYLDIQKIRMGRRLAYRVDVPDNLRNALLPSLMLPTLIENAIKHGIGPLREGGSIEIRARAVDGQLQVSVADTGRGIGESSGVGTGLANLRARLAAKYGAEGRLSLAPVQPHGVSFTLVLPFSIAAYATPPSTR